MDMATVEGRKPPSHLIGHSGQGWELSRNFRAGRRKGGAFLVEAVGEGMDVRIIGGADEDAGIAIHDRKTESGSRHPSQTSESKALIGTHRTANAVVPCRRS